MPPANHPESIMIKPLARPPDATVHLPGSKSITNRALVTAALAEGTSRLQGALFADDTLAMVTALDALGIRCFVDQTNGSITVSGVGNDFATSSGNDEVVVDARRSGTTARFLMPMAALRAAPVIIDGDAQLRARPMAGQIVALRSLGATIEELAKPGCLPVRVQGPIREHRCLVQSDVSSQFASGMLLAGAALRPSGLTTDIPTNAVSWPYLKMTLAVMRDFGAQAQMSCSSNTRNQRSISVSGGYQSRSNYNIEVDASAASYFLAAAAISGGRVCITGLGISSIQGDVAFAEVLANMGAVVKRNENSIELRGAALRGINVNLSDISDTAPTLAVVAAFAKGETTVTGIGFVRNKESDRVAASVNELQRCGVDAAHVHDGFVVRPNGVPHEATFETYQDHRMAMAFALVGLMVEGVAVSDPRCVEKTFPGYFEALDQLR